MVCLLLSKGNQRVFLCMRGFYHFLFHKLRFVQDLESVMLIITFVDDIYNLWWSKTSPISYIWEMARGLPWPENPKLLLRLVRNQPETWPPAADFSNAYCELSESNVESHCWRELCRASKMEIRSRTKTRKQKTKEILITHCTAPCSRSWFVVRFTPFSMPWARSVNPFELRRFKPAYIVSTSHDPYEFEKRAS